MTKLRKILTIYTCIVMLIGSINVFAEEEEIEEEQEKQETIEETTPSNYDLQQDQLINNLDSSINELNETTNNLTTLLGISGNHIYGLAKDFNGLKDFELNYYYEHFSEIKLMNESSQYNNNRFLNYGDSYTLTGNGNPYKINATWKNNRGSILTTTATIDLYINNYGTAESKWLKVDLQDDIDFYYCLVPYKLNINTDNALGSYTNSVTTTPYTTTNIYYEGQSITLTYDDTNNDFIGWYDNNGNLLSNQLVYTFNITQDTNLILNWQNPTIATEEINNIYYLLLVILGYQFIKGALTYDR